MIVVWYSSINDSHLILKEKYILPKIKKLNKFLLEEEVKFQPLLELELMRQSVSCRWATTLLIFYNLNLGYFKK